MLEVDTLIERADRLRQLRRFDEARTAATQALAQAPDDARAHRVLGEVELASGDLDRAAECAASAISAEPSVASHHLAARVARRRGEMDGAVEHCRIAHGIDPDHAPVHVTESLALSGPMLHADRSGRFPVDETRWAAARTAADRALELDPDLPSAHYASAVTHLLADRSLDAVRALERGLEIDPEWADGHVLLGAVRTRQGMVKLASRHFAAAGRLEPGNDAHVDRLRSMRGRARSLVRRRPTRLPAHLSAEARAILARDDELGGR